MILFRSRSPAYHDGARRRSKPRSKITSSSKPTFQFSLIHLFSKLFINPRKKTSVNIPFDIQMEIIKKVFDVKLLIRFRSVSKQWKSFIDSSEFIKGYGAHHTHPHSHILSDTRYYRVDDVENYIFVVEDDIETFKVQKQEVAPFGLSPLLKQYDWFSSVVGACHGLLCWFGISEVYQDQMLVIWNPSVRKSFDIVVPIDRYGPKILNQRAFGFGVCPVTSDPTVIKILCAVNMPWHVEVFTLSSGAWNVIPTGNLPRRSIKFNKSAQVVIDRFIYWSAWEKNLITKSMVLSFDLTTKEFNVVDLPDSLTKKLVSLVSVSKLRESLVVYGDIVVEGAIHCGIWVMEHDLSFRKLFTIGVSVKIVGFKENGETIFEKESEEIGITRLAVYDPCSQEIKNLGISGELEGSFFMGSYKESLLLLDHPDGPVS